MTNTAHERVHALLDDAFGAGIDGGGSLVENHDGGIGDGGAGDGDELALALAEAAAVAGKDGLIALGQHADERIRAGQLGGLDTLLVGSVEIAIAQVFHNGAGKEVHIL